MPSATIGGISLILYGMISAVGVRNVVENHVDLSKSRNVIIAALILVLAIGIKFGTGDAEGNRVCNRQHHNQPFRYRCCGNNGYIVKCNPSRQGL